ncbi:MAG: hypothetical protein IPL61_02650 [Myxococcales bacterium]|nr:hypothetical protein [Myxococcales bacterium]
MIDPDRDYADYLDRFHAAVGDVAVGAFVKHQGHLIQKLDAAAFAGRYREYLDLAGHYLEGIERGDTVNDLVVKMIRDHAAQLVLTAPL